MNKVFLTLFADIAEHIKTPEAQRLLESHIIRPVISTVLNLVYPYLLGVMLLWIIMFICVALILLILVRGSLASVIKVGIE